VWEETGAFKLAGWLSETGRRLISPKDREHSQFDVYNVTMTTGRRGMVLLWKRRGGVDIVSVLSLLLMSLFLLLFICLSLSL